MCGVREVRSADLAPERECLEVVVDLSGFVEAGAAGEVVRIAVEALAAAGVVGVSIDFTLPDLVDVLAAGPLPVPAERIDALRDRLDAKDAGGVAAIAPDYLPLIEAAGPFGPALDRLRGFDGALWSEEHTSELQ